MSMWSGDIATSPGGTVHGTEAGPDDGAPPYFFVKLTLCGLITEMGQPVPGWTRAFAGAPDTPEVTCEQCRWVITQRELMRSAWRARRQETA